MWHMWNTFLVIFLAFLKCKNVVILSGQGSNCATNLLRNYTHYFSIVRFLKELCTPGKMMFAHSISTEPYFKKIWTLSLVWQQIQSWSLSLLPPCSLSASGRHPGQNPASFTAYFRCRPLNDKLPPVVWRLPLQWPHGDAHPYLPVHQRVWVLK